LGAAANAAMTPTLPNPLVAGADPRPKPSPRLGVLGRDEKVGASGAFEVAVAEVAVMAVVAAVVVVLRSVVIFAAAAAAGAE
jgi:hypothetical protein